MANAALASDRMPAPADTPSGAYAAFEARKRAAQSELRAMQGEVRLGKDTSNLFRERVKVPAKKLNVRAFNHVLNIDGAAKTIDTEAMVSFDALSQAALANGFVPPVVPQLKSITIGGALAGLGIESSSFRYGLVHDTIDEVEVLLASGDVVVARPDNQYSDLFFGLPNSFGTLGYALRIKTRAIPAKKYVHLTHIKIADPVGFFKEMDRICADPQTDFIDGVVFEPGVNTMTVGRFVDDAPYVSDYTYMNIYYKTIRTRDEDYLTTYDYLWRWDTDWFWCARVLGLDHPLMRRMFGRSRLNSTYYMKLVNFNNKYRIRQRLRKFSGTHQETIIQDVDVPMAKAPEFLDFYQREIDLRPLWTCPFKSFRPQNRFPFFDTDRTTQYVNFGFWDAKTTKQVYPEGHFNKLIEDKLFEVGGTKSLYADNYFTKQQFHDRYNGAEYDALKAKYDPQGRLADLYRKCVLHE